MASLLDQMKEKADGARQLGKAIVYSGVGLLLVWMTDEAKKRVKNKLGITK